MFGREDFEFDMKTEENEIPGVQPENPAQSEHFGDFIVKYMQNVENTMELFPGTTFQAVNEIFGILYVPLENTGELEITGTSYNSIPKCYTYMDMEAAGASGITRLHDHPYLKLRGKGTAVAVIDSGIDYQNEVFRNAGGSRMIWELQKFHMVGCSEKGILIWHWIPRIRFPSCRPGIPTATVRRWQALLPEIWFREKISQEQRQRQPLSL